jgi:proteasome lid subunit RPN8/RPN11
MKKKPKRVFFKKEVVEGILAYSKGLHPREAILLLRGKVKEDAITITELVVPPLFQTSGNRSYFPVHMLPIDLSILGTAHSHPSGLLEPSQQDLLNVFGILMIIVGYPYENLEDVALFDKQGNKSSFEVI